MVLLFQESLVACAALDALSMFDPSDFKLIHLPAKVSNNIIIYNTEGVDLMQKRLPFSVVFS